MWKVSYTNLSPLLTLRNMLVMIPTTLYIVGRWLASLLMHAVARSTYALGLCLGNVGKFARASNVFSAVTL